MIERVPVHDAICVHAADCRCDFVEHITRFLLRQIVPIYDYIEQFFSLTVLSDDVDELCLLVYLIYLENGGVVLRGGTCTIAFSNVISFRVIVLARGNFSALIFLIARRFPVC